jgi:hypothetical protein
MIASSGPAVSRTSRVTDLSLAQILVKSLAIESIPAYVDLEEVPAYDAIVSTSSNQTPAPSTEHVYTLSRSDTTITFKLKSDAPATRSSPLYFKLSNITGSVHIEVRNKSNVRAVSVKVRRFFVSWKRRINASTILGRRSQSRIGDVESTGLWAIYVCTGSYYPMAPQAYRRVSQHEC